MTSGVRVRSESLPLWIPEVHLSVTAPFRGGRKLSKNHLPGDVPTPNNCSKTLSKSEGHLPSIRQSDSVVKKHSVGGRKERKMFLDLSPLYRKTISKSEEHLPSIFISDSDSGAVRRHSTPKNAFLASPKGGSLSPRYQTTKLGNKRRKVGRYPGTRTSTNKGGVPEPSEASENGQQEAEEEYAASSSTSSRTLSLLRERFLLPPLPTGSLTYQTALKGLRVPDGGSSSDDSGSESGDGEGKFGADGKRRRMKPKLAWYGPIVQYKNHHVYLSTLNTLRTNAGRYAQRPWC